LQRNQTFGVFDFTTENYLVFHRMISIGKQVPNGGYARTPVRAPNGFLRLKPMRQRPTGPDASYCWGGIDQDAVKIKQQSTARNLDHD
jgi:hypothetical protein